MTSRYKNAEMGIFEGYGEYDELDAIEEPGHIGNARCSEKDLADRARQEEYARKLIASYEAKGRI